jgi:hypothetical protein
MKSLFGCIVLSITLLSSTKAQLKIDSPADLSNWLPATVAGYTAAKDVYTAELSQDGAVYFITAKKYTAGAKTVSIVVFDYRGVSERIVKATSSCVLDKKYEDDAQFNSNSMVAGFKTVELYEKNKKTTQLYLYFADRYLITLSATAQNLDFLKQVAETLSPSTLPRY